MLRNQPVQVITPPTDSGANQNPAHVRCARHISSLMFEGILASSISALASCAARSLSAQEYSEALAMIGRFGGMALNITTLPYIIVSSMLTVLVPELSLHSKKNFWSAEERIARVLRIAALVGILQQYMPEDQKHWDIVFMEEMTLHP